MAAQRCEADDLDFMLRDTLRDVVSATPDTARAWTALRARIAPERPIACRLHRKSVRHSYLEPVEWTLDRYLVSLGRTMH